MVNRSNSKSEMVRELLRAGMAAADIAKKVGCTTGLVYNVKSRLGGAVRRPGRPSKAVQSAGGLDGFLDAIRSTERERERLRATLQRVADLVAEAL